MKDRKIIYIEHPLGLMSKLQELDPHQCDLIRDMTAEEALEELLSLDDDLHITRGEVVWGDLSASFEDNELSFAFRDLLVAANLESEDVDVEKLQNEWDGE